MRWFSNPYLWRAPHTRAYHDPAVLWDALASATDIPTIRVALGMPPVTPDGRGYAELQVREAHKAFLGYLEKKGYRVKG